MAENNKKARNFLVTAVLSGLLVALVQGIWPGTIPFDTFAIWLVRGGPADWLGSAWPFLAWGAGATAVIEAAGLNDRVMRRFRREGGTPGQIFVEGAVTSLQAGVFEEIAFRWLIFYAEIVAVKIMNFLIFGFLGFGVYRFLHLELLGPIADFTTFGALHPQLFHASGWAVGAALLTTNATFRNGHAYLGWFGLLNSWFLGMFFFWIMFAYGLPIAILLHVLYDLLIFSTVALFAAIRR